MFAGEQLTVLADDVLVERGAYTDYTDTNGQWNTVNGDDELLDKTVWTRYIHYTPFYFCRILSKMRREPQHKWVLASFALSQRASPKA